MKAAIGVRTDVGRVREGNEDSYLVEEPLFVVADGMGGHLAGDVASQTAIQIITDKTRDGTDPATLSSVVREANKVIFNKARQDSALRGMGTTCTLLLLADDSVHLAHVGDSRAYLFRDGELKQVSEDHTLVQRMVREGRIRPDEADRHPQRNIITRALGMDANIDVDTTKVEARPGDRYMICSDGLTSMIDDDTIAGVLARGDDAQSTVDELVSLALEAGGEDNVTVLLIDIVDSDPVTADSVPAAAAGAEPAAERTPTPSAPPPASTSSPVVPTAAGAEVVPKRSAGRLVVAAALVVAILLAVGYIGVRYLWIERNFFVGVNGDRVVTIYRGVPGDIAGMHLHRPEQVTDLPLVALPEFLREDVAAGIPVESLEEAETRVAELEELANDPEFESGSEPPEADTGGTNDKKKDNS